MPELPEGVKRWTIRTCEYPGCDLIEEGNSVTHAHPHRKLKSPPYTETPLSEPFEVIRVSDLPAIRAAVSEEVRGAAQQLPRFTGAHIATKERDGTYVELDALDAALKGEDR